MSEQYLLPGSTTGSSLPMPPSGFVPEEPRVGFVPTPPSPQAQSARYERPLPPGMENFGPRTVEQLSKDYADLVNNAHRVEAELRQTKTNLDTCGVERTNAITQATSYGREYEAATQAGIAIERRAMLCQQQIDACKELQRDYNAVIGENEFLKSEIQRLTMGQPSRRQPPAAIYERREPQEEQRPVKSEYRKPRRPLPPPESPVCAIL